MNGQMTFLEGRRKAIERSYRRSIGITPEDEMEAMLAIIRTRTMLQVIMREGEVRQRVTFGASLDEWMHEVNVDPGFSFSHDWVRARGVRYKK